MLNMQKFLQYDTRVHNFKYFIKVYIFICKSKLIVYLYTLSDQNGKINY